MTCTMNYEPMARRAVCRHAPRCPSATAPDWAAAHTVIAHPEQGWSLLCNGAVLFDDTGGLLPDGHVAGPRLGFPPGSVLDAFRDGEQGELGRGG